MNGTPVPPAQPPQNGGLASSDSAPQPGPDSQKGGGTIPKKQPHTPWLGIGGVLIGLSISVFLGQMLSVGLADLRGAFHLSVDQGAWLPATYNAGQMFAGPLTVYLGGLIGPRRVLLVSSPVVAATMILAPLTHSYPLLLTWLALAGLACGSFYPLTLTYVARSLPRPYILFGVAAYGIDVVSSSHVSSLLEGVFMEHLSWQWLFLFEGCLAPVMFALVYFGMSPDPSTATDAKKLRPTWAGFVYASCGFVSFYLLLTQGERLDWWRSGLINGLAVCGVFLLAASMVQHFLQPNPLVHLRFLLRPNILLLSLCLCALRFSLLSSLQLVPQFLGITQAYHPLQTGSVLAWVALPAFAFSLAAALSLRYLDPRLVLSCGFAVVAAACLADNRLSSVWARQNFLPTEMVVGSGAGIAVSGLIGCILLEVVNSGAVKQPVDTLTFVAWFHTVRLLGGEVVTAFMGHVVRVREQFHSNMLSQFITLNNPRAQQQVKGLAGALLPHGSGSLDALGRASVLIAQRVRLQAYTLAIMDGFTVEAVALTGCLLVIALIGREPLQLNQLLKSES